jgi:rubrerythrin
VDVVVRQAEEDPLDLAGFIDEKRLSESSLPELLRFAAKFEAAMATYYEEAAKHATIPRVKAVLERLAGEERGHERFVGDLAASLTITPEENPEEFPAL